jgi:hypothetical protein
LTVIGAGGRDLRKAWRDGAEAYLGISVAGFPGEPVPVRARRGPPDRGDGNPLDVRPEVQRQFSDWVRRRFDPAAYRAVEPAAQPA